MKNLIKPFDGVGMTAKDKQWQDDHNEDNQKVEEDEE